jgi:hypothetical protein
MNRTAFATVLTIICATVVTAAAADDPDALRRIRIDLRAGAKIAGTDPDVTIAGERVHAKSSQGIGLGLGLGYALNDTFDVVLDGESTGEGTKLHLFDSGTAATFDSITAGMRYYPFGRRHRVRPWLIGEGGWYDGHAATFDNGIFHHEHHSVSDSGGGLNVGAGFDVPVGHLVSLGADVRYNKTLGVFDDPSNATAMAHLSFHFWK